MKFYGQFEIPVDQFIFERYFPDLRIKGIFVECGAFDGELDSCCKFFEESMGWSGINIEAVPSLYQQLEVNRPNSLNLNVGLSSKDGTQTFTHAIAPGLGSYFGNGSLTHSTKHREELEERGCSFEEITINTITWNSLVEQHKLEKVDLFVLDVEGHELEVLEGMKGCAVLPDVICIEFGHLDQHVIRLKLRELGYVYDINCYANAFFVRKDALPLFTFRQSCILPRGNAQPKPVTGEGMTREALLQEIAMLKETLANAVTEYSRLLASKRYKIGSFIASLTGR